MCLPIVIDGSIMEGGGQILRLAVSLSSLLKKPIKITNIRAKRRVPGLRPQHLKGIELARELCRASLVGGEISSKEIIFTPSGIIGGNFIADTETAGSVVLMFQVTLPIVLFSPSTTFLRLKGGTNADLAPPIDYTITVFRHLLNKFEADFKCDIYRRGYYPKGGGDVNFTVSPVPKLSAVNITSFGNVLKIWGRAFVAGSLPLKLAHNLADHAEAVLKSKILNSTSIDITITRIKESPAEAMGPASGIVLFAETDTGCILSESAVGNRNEQYNITAEKAAVELANSINMKFCIDNHSQDQIIILMALAEGCSQVLCGPLTEHTQTAIYVAETLTNAKFTQTQLEDRVLLQCEGIGLQNKFEN